MSQSQGMIIGEPLVVRSFPVQIPYLWLIILISVVERLRLGPPAVCQGGSKRAEMCRLACKTAECCCIFSRQTGGKLIGFFYIILFFFSMLGPVIELHKHRSISFQDDDDDGEAKVVESEDANIFVLMEQTRRSGHVDVKTAMIFLIISLLIGLLINVLMVWGIYMKFCWFLLPWLLFQIAFGEA